VKSIVRLITDKLIDWMTGILTSFGIASAVELSKQWHMVPQSLFDVLYKTNDLLGVDLDIYWWINFSCVLIGVACLWWRKFHPPAQLP
jgi:cell division protein FtsX